MFETKTVGPCLVQKLKCGGHGPPGHPGGYVPANVFKNQGNRGDKIILNIFAVAMLIKLVSCMVLSTKEKSSSTATFRYSWPQIELSLQITENFQETIHDAATFLKLVLVTGQLFLIFAKFSQ